MSIFYLVSVAEETGLGIALSETPKTGFVETRLKMDVGILCFVVRFVVPFLVLQSSH